MLAITCPCVMPLLGIDKLIASIDSGQFISAYSPCQDLFFPCVRVETPDAILFYQWDRKRPILSAYVENHHAARVFCDTMHLPVFRNEPFALFPILSGGFHEGGFHVGGFGGRR